MLFVDEVCAQNARLLLWKSLDNVDCDDTDSAALRVGMGGVSYQHDELSLKAAARKEGLHKWMSNLLKDVTADIQLCIANTGSSHPFRHLQYESEDPHKFESYRSCDGDFYDVFDAALLGMEEADVSATKAMFLTVHSDGNRLTYVNARGATWTGDLGERLVPFSPDHECAAVWGMMTKRSRKPTLTFTSQRCM